MLKPGVYTIANLPEGFTAVHCPVCGFADSLQRKTLLATLGPNVSLPEALAQIAKCPRNGDRLNPCGVRWGSAVPYNLGLRDTA